VLTWLILSLASLKLNQLILYKFSHLYAGIDNKHKTKGLDKLKCNGRLGALFYSVQFPMLAQALCAGIA
jgi:hypothetical protein